MSGPDGQAGEPDVIPPEPFTAGERALGTPAGQPETLGGIPYAEDFREIEPWELDEEQESYRAEAYEAALHYARDYGLEIFTVWWMKNARECACKLGEWCPDAGKHPVDLRWPDIATSDPERAAQWWRKMGPGDQLVNWRPRANIGARMGQKRFILDVDTDEGKRGEESLARLLDEHAEVMPDTLTWQTGGGGRQYIYLAPAGTEVRSSASKLAPGLDIRGYNGYGILPPSRSRKGGYLILRDRSPDVAAPGGLANWLGGEHRQRTVHIRAHPPGDPRQIPADGLTRRAHAYITAAFSDAVAAVRAAEETTRNNTLNAEAFDLFSKFWRGGVLGADDITAAMQAAGEACGLDEIEVDRTIGSALDGAQRKDRSGELPDFVYEEPVTGGQAAAGDLVMPSIDAAILAFEQLYDLRACGEEFFARPADTGTPAVVTEIGDAMKRAVMNWWRDAAVAWNAELTKGRAAATEAFIEQLEARDPLEQLAILKDLYFERRKKQDENEDDEGKWAVVFPAIDTFTRIVEHLRASASRHEPVELHLRVVDGPGFVVVDLAGESGSVVLITADGWRVCDVREVEGVPWFKRGPAMLPQVIPVAPEDVLATLEQGRQVLGLDAAQWRIALSGVIGAYFPSIARPGPWISGPSGTGKTTRGEMLAGWIDPMPHLGGRINLKRDERNARAKAMNTFIFTIDNASLVSQDESDFWCSMHTGASDQVRKLHSDNTMLNYSYRRIGMGTSLVLPAGFQADVLRRILHIQLAGTDKHPDSEALWKAYNQIKPAMLGAIFTLVAGVLANLDKAMGDELAGVPEMSDFARRLHAADLAVPGLGHYQEQGLFETYRLHAVEVLVSAGLEDPLALLVLKVMDQRGEEDFIISPTGLLTVLRAAATGNDEFAKWFPADATRMGDRLVKLDGPLRRLGVEVTRGQRTSRYIPYVLRKIKPPDSGAGGAGSGAGNEVSTT